MNYRLSSMVVVVAMTFATPAIGQGIGHSFFMRGSVVGADSSGVVVCIGKADNAEIGQTLEVYRNSYRPDSVRAGRWQYHRDLVGHVRIDKVFDEHFAHVTIIDGRAGKNDIVELKK